MKTVSGAAQGDILLVPCAAIPDGAVAVVPERGRLIVARGEATGHHHSFAHNRGAVLFRDDASGGALYVRAEKPVALQHQEHGEITFGAGTYKVLQQRTYVAGLARRVAD